MRTQLAVAALVLFLSAAVLGASKEYQTGTLAGVDAQLSSQMVSAGKGKFVQVETLDYSLTVQFGDLLVTGLCTGRKWGGCHPGSLVVGDPVEVRIDKDTMYVKRPDGKDVKTKIVRRNRVKKEP